MPNLVVNSLQNCIRSLPDGTPGTIDAIRGDGTIVNHRWYPGTISAAVGAPGTMGAGVGAPGTIDAVRVYRPSLFSGLSTYPFPQTLGYRICFFLAALIRLLYTFCSAPVFRSRI